MAYESCQVWIEFATWVNVTEDVEPVNAAIRATDGEDREASDKAGSLTIVLRDIDGRYTPGNTQGVHYPYVTSGRRVMVFEVIGTERFDIFTGRLEWPEVDSWVQTSTSAPREQTITLTAVDLPTQLDSAAELLSTMGEHILYTGGNALKAYWPRNDAAQPFLNVVGDEYLPTTSEQYVLAWGDPTASSGTAKVIPAAVDGPPGDDLRAPSYEMELQTVGGFLRPGRTIMTYAELPSGALPILAAEYATVVMWVKSPWTATDSEAVPLSIRWQTTGEGVLELVKQDGATSGWLLDSSGSSGMVASFTSTAYPATSRWTIVAVRWRASPMEIELWVDGEQVVGVPAGAVGGASSEITKIYMPQGRFDGNVAHVQVYIGDEDAFTFADFTAQRLVGLQGLDRQTTGERIRTILGYAGIGAGEMGEVDDGTAVMPRARLAGTTPGAQIRLAVDTELGDFHANGSGRPVFLDRRTLYNN